MCVYHFASPQTSKYPQDTDLRVYFAERTKNDTCSKKTGGALRPDSLRITGSG